jgi:hypothetical protein
MILAAWRARQLRAQQKRKAIQMLALSGVVRPSDVELRYPIPLIKISGTHTAPKARSSSHKQKMAPPLSESSPLSPSQRAHLFQWLRQDVSASSQ